MLLFNRNNYVWARLKRDFYLGWDLRVNVRLMAQVRNAQAQAGLGRDGTL
jgi:hypothetical protein